MAAPNSAYRSEVIHDGTTIANSAKGLIAIPSAEEAVLKARFYLDWIMAFEKDGVRGFIGGVTHLSDNYYMHNTARHYTLRGRGPAGQLIYWFNEAGLNTLGPIENLTFQLSYANFLTIRIRPKSAWHVNTDSFGVEIKLSSQDWSQAKKFSYGSLPQQQHPAARYYVARPEGWTQGQNVNVRAFLTNAEGTFVSANVQNITLGPVIHQMLAAKRSTVCGTDNTIGVLMSEATKSFIESFSSTSDQSTGHYVYSGENVEEPFNTSTGNLIPASAGLYAYLDTGDNTKVIELSSTGEVRKAHVCVPTIPVIGYLSIMVDFNTNQLELSYLVQSTVNQTYTVTGQIVEFLGESQVGVPMAFSVTIAANTSNVTWNTKPTPTHVYGGKFRYINVGKAPNVTGDIIIFNEL